jgi:phosphate-selective porin OprO/OprP
VPLAASPAQHFAAFADSEPWLAPNLALRRASFQASTEGGERQESDADVDALRRRVQALEEQVKRSGQSEKREASKTGPAGGWEHNIFGRIQADTVTMGQTPGNVAQLNGVPGNNSIKGDYPGNSPPGHAPNGTDFRRTRIGVQGTGYDVYFYRFEVDFSNPDQVLTQVPRLTDAYGEIRQLPFGTLRMGEFRVPMSIERITSANDLLFLERGLPQAFNPARQLGIMAFNSTQNYFFSWYSDLSTWKATNQAEQYGKAGRFSYTQRFVFLPWYDEPSDGRYLFHVGGAYQWQNVRNNTVSYSTTPEAVLQYGTTKEIIPNFISTGNITARDVQILQAEASTVLGPLSFQAEYYGVFVDPTVKPAAYNGDLFFSGWYVDASYFLTGEHRIYNREQALYTTVTPYSNFFRVRGSDGSVIQGPGAWELAFRVSQMNLSDRTIQGGLLNVLTFGVNWHLTKSMKVMANYTYAINNIHNNQTYADVFSTRAQVVW